MTVAGITGTDFTGGRGRVGNLAPGKYLFMAGGTVRQRADGTADPIGRDAVGVLEIVP